MLHATSDARQSDQPSAWHFAALNTLSPERVALAAYLIAVGIVLGRIIALTGGGSLYSLDDAYIHLALSERIRLGHYGLNMGEITSPSSSVIWPFLLVPTAGTRWGVATPLVLNVVFGATAAWLLGRIASFPSLPHGWSNAGGHFFRLALACLMVMACNLANLAFTGLEHSLQVLIAVALALALLEHARGRPLPNWTLALAALGPSIRYEMFALTAAVCLVLAFERHWRSLAMVAAGSLVLPLTLAGYLVANGGYPLPNSVMAKLTPEAATGTAASAHLLWDVLARKAAQFLDLDLSARIALLASIATMAWLVRTASGAWRNVLLGGIAAGLLHFVAGQFGWWYRYELYAIAFCGSIAVAGLMPRAPYAAMLGVILAAYHYLPSVSHTPLAALNVHEQHHQMQRFVAEHYRKPFAVNDVGLVSIGLADGPYVLDLWGLASNEALRRKDKSAQWLDDVTRRHDAGLAMIYSSIFREIPASWRAVGELKLASRRITAAYEVVTFYATAVGDKAEIKAGLEAFRPTLPPGVLLTLK